MADRVVPRGAPGVEALPVVAALDGLDAAGIRWCIWKGSDHVAASLAGARDLDVLVDPAVPAAAVADVLERAGLRRARSGPNVEAVEDWLGLAGLGGGLVHVQLYRAVLVDDGLVARWDLPVVDDVLDHRVRGDDGLWVADPAEEAVLLLVQGVARAGVAPTAVVGARGRWLDAWLDRAGPLVARTSPEAVADVARRWFGDRAGRVVGAAARGQGGSPARLASEVAPALSAWVAAPGLPAARARALGGKVRSRSSRRRRVGGRWRRRQVPGGGLIVAVVGADGAGKSSLVARLTADYAAKVDTRMVYFGSGSGPSLPGFAVLKLARRVLFRLQRGRTGSAAGDGDSGGRLGVARIVWALSLGREKVRKAQRAARDRERGAIVFCDRYPQVQEPGVHDGPRLARLADDPRRWARAVARWERRSYDRALRTMPDLTLRLRVSPAVAERRRSDHDPIDLRRRIEVIERLRLPGRVVDLDADQSPDEVAAAAHEVVFEQLAGPRGTSPVVVELCGLPAAGKTKVVEQLVARLRAEGLDAADLSVPAGPTDRGVRLRQEVAAVTRAAVRSPATCWRVLAAVGRAGVRGRERIARSANLVTLSEVRRRAGGGIAVLDQGIVQELGSIGQTGDVRRCLDALPAGFLPAPEVIVRLSVPTEVASERLARRGTRESRLERLATGEREAALRRWDATLDEVLVELARSSDSPALGEQLWTIDATAPDVVDDLTARLVNRLTNTLHPR